MVSIESDIMISNWDRHCGFKQETNFYTFIRAWLFRFQSEYDIYGFNQSLSFIVSYRES